MKIIILLLLSSVIFAQDISRSRLDSLFNDYIRIKSPAVSDAPAVLDTNVSKCAFGIVNSVRVNYDNFNPEQQIILRKLFARPQTQTSVVTPSGLFRVHYDTSGTQALRYDLNLLLEAVDSSYNYEVRFLGYLPQRDNNTGGDDKYDIYITNLGSLYGYTELEDRIAGQTYTSFIVLDNAYQITKTKGIDGARVTIAHELHHAIQIGNYNYRDEDLFFHEMASTAMEEFVYNTINDYYYYMYEFFNNPDESMQTHSGYDLAIWDIFLKEEFGSLILLKQWEHYKNNRALDAIALSISDRGSNFQDVFNRFGIWTFYTGYRFIPGKFFKEGASYPVIRQLLVKTFTPPSDSMMINAEPVSHNFFSFANGTDTLTVLLTNSDYRQAIQNPAVLQPALYELYSDSAAGLILLADGYYQRFTPAGSSIFWASSEFLNNQLLKEGFVRIEEESAFPSPFRYSKASFLYIPVKQNRENDVLLYIYSSSMDLVYSSRVDIIQMFGKSLAAWNGRDSENQKLGTGIYMYVVKSGEDINKGKIIIFND
jgi:hypothetical protein